MNCYMASYQYHKPEMYQRKATYRKSSIKPPGAYLISHLPEGGLTERGLIREGALDCVHMMPAHFENDEKCDGSKI